MPYQTILVEKKNKYSIVTMHRPDEMNAISQEMRRELEDCFTRLEEDGDVRVIILTGGDYVFSAGLDLKAMAAGVYGPPDSAKYRKGFDRLYSLKSILVYGDLVVWGNAADQGGADFWSAQINQHHYHIGSMPRWDRLSYYAIKYPGVLVTLLFGVFLLMALITRWALIFYLFSREKAMRKDRQLNYMG